MQLNRIHMRKWFGKLVSVISASLFPNCFLFIVGWIHNAKPVDIESLDMEHWLYWEIKCINIQGIFWAPFFWNHSNIYLTACICFEGIKSASPNGTIAIPLYYSTKYTFLKGNVLLDEGLEVSGSCDKDWIYKGIPRRSLTLLLRHGRTSRYPCAYPY